MDRIIYGTKFFAGQPETYSRILSNTKYDTSFLTYPKNPFNYHGGKNLSRSRAARRILHEQILEQKPYAVHFWQSGILSPYIGSWDLINEYESYLKQDIKVYHRFTGFDLRLPEVDILHNRHSVYKHGYKWPFSHACNLRDYKKYLDTLLALKEVNFCVGDSELGRFLGDYKLTPRVFARPANEPVSSTELCRKDNVFKIIHAPSNAACKGTRYIDQAIADLRKMALPIDYVKLEGVPHSQVLRELSTADLVIDQILIGAPGVFTLEAWSMGKPVVCYLSKEVCNDYDCVPVLNVNPENLLDQLRIVMKDQHQLKRLAKLGHEIYSKFHAPDVVQETLINLYSGKSETHKGSYRYTTNIKLGMLTKNKIRFVKIVERLFDRSLPNKIFTWWLLNRTFAKLSFKMFKYKMLSLIKKIIIRSSKMKRIAEAMGIISNHNFKKNYKMCHKNMPINRYLNAAQKLDLVADSFKADLYIAHGVQALPMAARQGKKYGAKVYCDAIEIPSFRERALPSKWDDTTLDMMDYGLEGFLRNCDGVITVGEALGKILHKYNSLVTVIPNYRYSENLDRLPNLRDEFCISNDDKVVLCISHITTSLEEVIHAVSSLSNEVKLVIVGQILPPEYKQKIVSIIDDLGLNKRVFIRDPVPYSELTSYASGADIGLIVRDPAISNNYISFPNRVFDYVFSGLPIVTPYMPDISRFVEVNKCGVSIDGIGRDSWKYGINKALDNRDLFSNGAIKASKKYTWEWLNDNVIKKAFNEFQSIAFVGINDLSKNNRTIRLCRSLVSNSKDVSVLSPLESPESFPSEVRLINTMDLE